MTINKKYMEINGLSEWIKKEGVKKVYDRIKELEKKK